MNRFVIACALPVLACSAAFADPVEVSIPENPAATEVSATAYTDSLLKAVDKVCRDEVGPVVGLGYWSFRACRTATTREVAMREPTGLLASRLGLQRPVQVASK